MSAAVCLTIDNLASFSPLRIKKYIFFCRTPIRPGQHWPNAPGRGEARWHFDPKAPQVCSSVSLGLPFRAGPWHPDLSRGRAYSASHRAPYPPAEDPSLLRLHQMWQGVLGGLSFWPCPLNVSGGLAHFRRGQWICCRAHYSCSAELTVVESVYMKTLAFSCLIP